MDLKYLTTVAELIVTVGDDPGHSARQYASTPTSVNQLKLRKLENLEARGLIEDRPVTVRGQPASRLHLTAQGQAVYGLLCALRALPEPHRLFTEEEWP